MTGGSGGGKPKKWERMGGSRSPSRPTGSSGASEARNPKDPCDISFETTVTSPNPKLLNSVQRGEVLQVGVERTQLRGAPVETLVIRKNREVAGGVDDVKVGDVIDCIKKGFSFVALVTNASGGLVNIEVKRK